MFRWHLGVWLYGVLKVTIVAVTVTAEERSVLERLLYRVDGSRVGVGKAFCTFDRMEQSFGLKP